MSDAGPGWYPDPARDAPPGRLRWWDGSAWSGHVYNQGAAAAPPPGTAPGYAPPAWGGSAAQRKPMRRGVVVAIVAAVVALFGSCGALLYSARDEFVEGFNEGFLDPDKQLALQLCRDLARDVGSPETVGVNAATDRSTLIDRENVGIERLLSEADQELLNYGDLAVWSDAWREILDRREGYAGRMRALGDSAQQPSLLAQGERLDARISQMVPGCGVPPAVLDDFAG